MGLACVALGGGGRCEAASQCPTTSTSTKKKKKKGSPLSSAQLNAVTPSGRAAPPLRPPPALHGLHLVCEASYTTGTLFGRPVCLIGEGYAATRVRGRVCCLLSPFSHA